MSTGSPEGSTSPPSTPAPGSPTRIDRRVALEWILAASAAMPFLGSTGTAFAQDKPGKAKLPAAKGYGPDPDMVKAYRPGDVWPLTFTGHQRQTVIVLEDIIMPADDRSPSASELKVHDFVDEWISSPYRNQASDRNLILKGLDWLDEEAQRRGGRDFVSLDAKTQLAICQELAVSAKKNSKEYPGSFFYLMRNLVSGGYYTTPVGMRDIGYLGNMPMAENVGPTPEALAHLGLSPEAA